MARRFTVALPIVGAEVGDTLTEDDLQGVNIEGLLLSGHLVEEGTSPEVSQVAPTQPAAPKSATTINPSPATPKETE